MFNDILKKILTKRRGEIEEGFKIKIEIEPKEEAENKDSSLAPTVKDQAPEKKAFNPKLEPPEENEARGDSEETGEIEAEVETPVEIPIAREPMTLGERASSLMKKKKENPKLKKE